MAKEFNQAGTGNARQKNQQSLQRAGQNAGALGQAGQANFELGSELGATGAAGTPAVGAGNARQRNAKALRNAGTTGRTGQ